MRASPSSKEWRKKPLGPSWLAMAAVVMRRQLREKGDSTGIESPFDKRIAAASQGTLGLVDCWLMCAMACNSC